VRFGDKIMRHFNILERDRTQNRIPLLLIARRIFFAPMKSAAQKWRSRHNC
jgi:hypothetical protein